MTRRSGRGIMPTPLLCFYFLFTLIGVLFGKAML